MKILSTISRDIIKLSHRKNSTIYALSSGHGKCGVALIRVSGPKAFNALSLLTKKNEFEPRKAYLRKLKHPNSGIVLDQALSVWFPGPASFTGEDIAEFQVHGGSAVVKAVLEALGSIDDLRPAKAGEFTKRAFQSGKLDLTEVEGLADLINAETEYQRRQAFKQMDGDLHRLYDKWSEMILNLSATVEASVDFSEDVGSIDEEEIKDRVKELVNSVELHMDDSNAGERLRDGVQVCILGKPNVGKSTLLNTLCRRPAAIVSPIAGTTRDTIEQYLDIGGFPIKIVDTAGIRDSNEADTIELEGIKRAENVAKSSDLIIIVVDSSEIPTNAEIHEWCRKSEQNLTLKSDRTAMKILVLNKCDLLSNTDFEYTKERLVDIENIILMSCVTGKGFDQFINILRDSVQNLCLRDKGFQLSGACLTRPRHRYHLDRALQHLKNYLKDMEEESLPLEIQAHYLSNAFREFGLLTGKITLSTLHDKIFSDFCIGK